MIGRIPLFLLIGGVLLLPSCECFVLLIGVLHVVLASDWLDNDSVVSLNFSGLNCAKMVTLLPDCFRIMAACSYVAHRRFTPLYCNGEKQFFSNIIVMFQLASVRAPLCCVTAQLKTSEQFFPTVLFIMLYKVILTFKPIAETLVCDHLNESY